MKTTTLTLFALVFLFSACDNNDDNEPLVYVTGQNRFTLSVEWDWLKQFSIP